MYIVLIGDASFICLSVVVETYSFLLWFCLVGLFISWKGLLKCTLLVFALYLLDPVSLWLVLYAAGRLSNAARCSRLLQHTTGKAQGPPCLGWSPPVDMAMQGRTARAEEVAPPDGQREGDECMDELWGAQAQALALVLPSRAFFFFLSKSDFVAV